MREAWCWDREEGSKVRCRLCIISCSINKGRSGRCGVRRNVDGSLYSLTYGRLSSFSTDFVEKIPLYHFYPNHRFLTVGSVGCNLSCRFCLTWNITQRPVEEVATEVLSPERLVRAARELGCRGIAYTHSEPTLNIEFYREVMDVARRSGLVNALATNGFLTECAFQEISGLLDAVALTIKGSGKVYQNVCGVRYERRHLEWLVDRVREEDVHLELVYVLIPGVNDDAESLREVVGLARRAGSPLIFLRFFPSYKMDDLPSPTDVELERALRTAYQHGVEYAYVENIFEHPGKNTYCPGCRALLVERAGYGIVGWRVKGSSCPSCGRKVPIVGDALLAGSVA